MSGDSLGRLLGKFIYSIKIKIYWKFSKLRIKAQKKQIKRKEHFLIEFIKSYRLYSNVPFVFCEDCGTIGIDFNSDDHGWHYHGGHIWSCPKCKSKKFE